MNWQMRGFVAGMALSFTMGCGGANPDTDTKPVDPSSNEKPAEQDPSPSDTDLHFSPPADWSTLGDRFGGARDHKGIDFKIGSEPKPEDRTKVKAIERGRVVDRQEEDCHGKYVVIKHPNGVYSMYAHLDSVADNVHVEDRVEKGQVLGVPGTTGRADCVTGPHLHLSMNHSWEGEGSWNGGGFFDPEKYIKDHP